MRIKLLALIAVCISAWPIYATTFSRLSAAEIYQHSDFVGLVEIETGHTISSGDEKCGVIYTANVIDQFKGAAMESIQFGPRPGYGVGLQYLAFLTQLGKDQRFLNSTNSVSKARRNEFLEICGPTQITWQVAHSAIGIWELTWATELDNRLGFAVPTRYIYFPDSVAAIEGNFDKKDRDVDMRWFRSDDVLNHLRMIAEDGS